jgi:hypothetical protein
MTQMSPLRLLYAIRPKSLLFGTGGWRGCGASTNAAARRASSFIA